MGLATKSLLIMGFHYFGDMTNNLVPTPIVDRNGKQTTVYKRVAGVASSWKLTSAIPELPAPAETGASPLDDVLRLFGEVDNKLESSLMGTTPEQLRDVEDAMVVALGREARGLSPKHNSGSLRLLVSGGAFTAVAKIAQEGDNIADSSTLASFGKRKVAKEIVDLISSVVPTSTGLFNDTVDTMSKTPTHYLDMVRRGAEHAVYLDKQRQLTDLTVSNTLPYWNMHSLGEYSVLEAFDKHWDALPEEITAEGLRSVMIALGDGRQANGSYVEVAAHLRACVLSAEHPFTHSGHQRDAGNPYVRNYSMRDAVERYPDKVDAIIQWNRAGRGSDYDSDVFREYITGGTLRDGHL